MKKSNKLIILSAFAFLVSLSFVMSAFLKSSQKNNADNKNHTYGETLKEKISEVESNVSDPVSKKENKSGYLIKIHGNKICAYIVTESGTTLWNSVSIPHGLTDEERKLLEEGINTESFEEMCLYLEAYVS